MVVSPAAGHLAGDVTWAGMGRFAVVFGLIWVAWIYGAVYHDLHGRAEGRTRSYVFLQMGVLALLAVFTGRATAGDGPAFAVVNSGYLYLLGWLWYSVRRQDDPAFRPTTTPYIAGVLVSATVVGTSAVLPGGARLALWALVVVGVVNGIADAGRTPIAVVTGILGLGIGFAYWWSYFDFVGARPVRSERGAPDWRDLAPVYHPVSVALGVAAVVALLLGWIAPPPWLQILLLTLVLGAVWLYGILTWFSFTHHDGASPAVAARPRQGQGIDRGGLDDFAHPRGQFLVRRDQHRRPPSRTTQLRTRLR